MDSIVCSVVAIEHSNRLRARTSPKPFHRRLNVVVDRRRAKTQNASDFLGRVPLRHKFHALTLPFAEPTNSVE